jgi:serine/threonine-protein kinase
MGEVYSALDTKLNREVAIKVIPENFAVDGDRMARFTREAQVLASLNHPNIAGIYGLEDRALVMELVPGQTLAERLADGALRVEEALRICSQIAEALEAAHQKGITHRDIKPANIKLTPEGRVKVLDFGLARVAPQSRAEEGSGETPTLTAMTHAGVFLGTPAYMSPEQARGESVDQRGDIWAFGCVFYELLVGRRVFSGRSTADIIASLLKTEPDWSALPAGASLKMRDLLRSCLQKDSHQRLQNIGDARAEIEAELRAPAITKLPEPERAIHSVAVLPFANASNDPQMEYLSDGITENIILSLSQLP